MHRSKYQQCRQWSVLKQTDKSMQVKFTKHGTIRYVRYGFLLCNSNFVRKIFDFKNAVTLRTGLGVRQGHWKCHNSTERIWLPIDVL